MQTLGRPTIENKKNINTVTEEFRVISTTSFHYKIKEEQLKIIRKSTLVYPVTTQE